MKKILLLLTAFTIYCTLGWAQVGVGQQFPNYNFESWTTETWTTTILWSTTTHTADVPSNWHSINDGTGSLVGSARNEDFVHKATGSPAGGQCVKLKSQSILGVKANGGLTTGRFNAGSMTAANSANCTYTSTNSNYNCPLTAYPDSVYMYVKTSSSSNNARINIVIHNNSVASNNAIYQDPSPTSANDSYVNTTGTINERKVVAKATWNNKTNNTWQLIKIPFDYNSYLGNNTTPYYVLATFSTAESAGGGAAGDELYLDDIVLIYNTRLATLKKQGTSSNISGFNPNQTTYDYSLCAGESFPSFNYTCQSAHANASIYHSPTTQEPYTIIRVTHQNQSNVYKDYRINFNVISALAAPIVTSDPVCAPQAVPVSVTANSTGATSYRWYTTATGGTGTEVTTSTFNVTGTMGSTTYYVSAVNAAGCESDRTPVTVTINSIPTAPTAGNTTPVCAGSTGTFTATLPSGDNLVCRWYESNSSTTVLGTGTSLQVQNLTQNTTRYASTYNTATGCESGRVAVTVNVNSAPNVTISPISPICAGESVTLTASGATSYTWDHNLGEGNNKQVSPNTTTTYTVTGSDAIGCTSTASVTVTVNQLPNVSINSVDPICEGQSATLTATGATSYSWDNNLGIGNDKVVSPTTQTTYTVTGTENGCSNTASITVNVNQLPTVSINSVDPICAGENTTLTATGATNYSWDHNLGEGNNKQVSPITTTIYNVTGTDNNGCSNIANVTVTVNQLPNVSINEVSPLCEGQSATLTATGATSYVWDHNLGEGNNKQVTPGTTTTYNVSGTDANGCSNTASVTVTVNSIPAAPVCQNDTLCGAGQAVLTALPAENCTCQWFNENNTDITASTTNNTTTYTTATLSQNTVYHVRSVNSITHCNSETVDIQVFVFAAPGAPTVSGNSRCGAGTVTLTATPGSNANTCRWYASDNTLLHEGTTYTIEELEETTIYYCKSYNSTTGCESSNSRPATATINPVPANPTISGNEAICAGQTLTVSASSTNATGFVWSDGQNNTEGATFTTPVLTENASYTVKAYNANCESEVVNFTVTVNPMPAAPSASSDTQCQNETISLSATATSGNTCYWYASATSTEELASGNSYSPANPSVGTTPFYVSQRSNSSNCESERTVVYATVNPTYSINIPVNACDSFRWGNELYVVSGEYTRNFSTQNGCDSIETLQLTINHSVTTTIDTTVCDALVWNNQTYETSGDYEQQFQTVSGCDSTVSLHLTVLNSSVGSDHLYLCSNQLPYNYNDITNIIAAGTYTLHTTNAAGCDSTINLTVTVNTQPSAATNLTPAERCGEGSLTLTAHAGQNGTTCRWYASEEATDVLFTGTSFITGNLSATTTYYVSSYNEYDGHACESGRQAITATINPNPAEPTVANQVRCGDGAVEFTATIDENATTCRWYLTQNTTNVNATGLTYSANVSVSNGSTSFYVESYNSTTGCKSSRKEVTAEAFAIPTAPVLTDMSNCGPQQFSIDAPTNGYYKWYDSEESTSTLDIENNTTPTVDASRSYFISHAVDYTGITCESSKAELVLTIYPVYEPQDLYDTLCQGDTYTQHGLNETFEQAGSFDRVLNTVTSHNCDSLVTLHLLVKEVRSYTFDTTVCDAFVWNSETFTASENITRHFTSSLGCDSVVTVNLTVNHSAQTEFEATDCDEYIWNNETYTISGDYTQHFLTVNGCDSAVTLHLTINHSIETNFNEVACDSYQWNDSIYTTSGNYVQLFRTNNNCDSTVTLHLTVNYSNAATLTDVVCAGTRYNANGFDTTITTAGTYTLVNHNLNQAGCDSTTTLMLTVNPVYNKDVTMTICETALPFTWNDITYPTSTPSGEYQHTYNTQSVSNCDSIVTLHLTISDKYVTPLNEHICAGDSYFFDGEYRTQTGVYYDTVLAYNGCDSIIILDLTVHELDTTTLSSTLCLGESYTENGFNVTPDTIGLNTYQRVVLTAYGCDSTIILNLTVNPVYYSEESTSTCDYAAYVWEGHNVQIGLLQAGTYTFWDSLKTVHNCDSVFKLNLTVNPSYFYPETANTCENEEYIWNGHNKQIGILAAGTYTIWDSLKTSTNCDSIYKLTLTVNPTFFEETSATTCDNEAYVWDGHNVQISLLEAGEHIIWDSLKTANYCDSVYKLTLTVLPSYFYAETASTCANEEYIWNGHNKQIGHLAAGTYTIWDSLKTANNCDSVYQLTLTVTPTFYEETSATTCDNQTFVWNGHEHITIGQLTEGTYTFWDSLTTSTYACDSIYKLTLTVNPTQHTDLYGEICEGDFYEYNNRYYEVQGDYNFNFSTALDCDSTVTLHLTVYPAYEKDTNITICQGMLPYNFADTMFYGSGNKDVMLHTQHGCDSIFHIHLNVTPYITASQTITICDNELPYQFLDSTFYAAGIYEVTETFASGCDKITTVTLIVNSTYDTTISVTHCGPYILDRGTYQRVLTESGIYVDTLSTLSGCDSIVRLNLTINPLKDTVLTPAICMGESYEENGFSIQPTAAGIVRDTLHLQCAGTGCDSTVYLELTVNPSYNISFDTTVCDQFVWNDITYTESDIISHSYTLATGCDSMVTINLTVNPSYNLTIDTAVCDQFVWNGQTYTQSETLQHTYTLNTGCDSTVTIHLTVNQSVVENHTVTICQSELPYTWRDITFDAETTVGTHLFTYNLETAQNCDSTVNLTLIVNPNNEYYDNPVSICEGSSYEWNGQVITESGIYTDTVPNEYNCYDVYKVVVTVNPVFQYDEYDTVCSNELPIIWQGRTINQAGLTEASYHSINYCDSTYRLHLTVNPSYFIEANATTCDNEAYVWEGHNVEIGLLQAGSYTIWDSLTTASGCDSVYKLNLTVTPTFYTEEIATTCDNEAYVWEGHNVQIGLLQAGEYIIWDSLTTDTYECDSIFKLTLTVTPSFYEESTGVTCANEAYVWAGHEHIQIGLLQAGEYTFWDSLTTNTYECDSVYKLTLTVNPTAHSVETASACSNEDILIWHGQAITTTGIYYDTLETGLGCDSVCELHFTLSDPTTAIFADTTCTNATYQAYGFEFTPSQSGDTTLVRITENAAGCDSTITLNLYVKPVATFSFDTIVCGAFNWNNQWYTESNTYTQIFTAANGCDSIVTMNLTIDTPASDTIEVTACESYEWDGTTYTQSGVYNKVYPQSVGCDSTAVMILTINHSTEVTLYDTTCLANHYQEYGFDTLITQMGTLNLQRIDINAAGCDSVINLMLTVHRSYLTIDSASTCDNDDFVWQGMHCDTTGIYVKSYPTIHGCDSAFVLFLTVNPSYEIDVTDSAIAGTPYHNHGLNFTPQTPGTMNIDVPRTTVDGCDSIVHVTLIVQDGSSINLHYLDSHIKLYPNPTEGAFTVNSTADIINELTIFDNNGKAVWQQQVNDYDAHVNVETLAPGLYFVRLRLPDNIVTKKLIVR